MSAISWSASDLPEKRLACPHARRLLRRRYKPGDRPPQPQRTFQNTWRARCEDDWLRAFYMFSFSAHPNFILRVHRASQSTCAMPTVCMHRGFDADDILCMCNMLHSCHSGEQGQLCWGKGARCRRLASAASCCAGIPWLFANLALASFIKFKDSPATAIVVTVVLGVGCMYFFLSHGRWLRYVSGSHTEMQEPPEGDWHALGIALCFLLRKPQ